MEKEFTSAMTWAFLDNLNEGVILVQPDGVVPYLNRAAMNHLGLTESPLSLTALFQDLALDEPWRPLLSPPYETRLSLKNGRSLRIQSKPCPHLDQPLIQLLITLDAGARQQSPIEQLTALTRISNEPDFDNKLQLIVDGLQMTGWNRVLLSLRDAEFNPTRLIMAGFSEEEKDYLRENMLPAETWRTLFADPNFERFRHGTCYFIPGDSDWSQKHLGMALPDPTAVPSHSNAWHPKDLLFALLHDREQSKIGLIGLDQPNNGLRPDPRTLQTIELYAQFAASIIENTQLFAETVERGREFELLFEANKEMSGTLDRDKALTLTGQHMCQAVRADGYIIYQWHKRANELVILQDYADPARLPDTHKERAPRGTAVSLSDNDVANPVLREQEPRVVAATNGEGVPLRRPDWLTSNQTYTSVMLPLVLSGETFGLVEIIDRDAGQTFGLQEIQLLVALANQAGTVLETALIFEDTYEREQFYNALGRVSLAINHTLERSSILGLICQESLNIFDVDGAYIWEREKNQFVGSTARGPGEKHFPDSIVPLSDEEAFVNIVAKKGEAVYVNHVGKNNKVFLRLPQKETVKAVLGVPLEQEEEIIGILILIDTQNPHRFSDKSVNQATTFGVQVALALRNAQLFEELRRFNEALDMRVAERTQALNEESNRVKILLRISSELTASLDQDRVLNQALELVNGVVNATQGVILLIDHDTDELIVRAALGMDPLPPRSGIPSGLKRDEGLAGWMIENRSAVIVPDTREDPRWVNIPKDAHHRSVLGVPLISNEEVIGVLMLFHSETDAFTRQQLDLVEAAAIQVSNAVNNANLYLLIRDQAERLGAMLRAEQIEAAKNQAILESIADGVLVADENNDIILANLPASSILDIPREQLIGKSINELLGLYGQSGDSWIITINDWAKNADRVQQWTYLADQLTIEEKVVSIHLSPVMTGQQFFGTVSIFRDITKEVEVDNLKSEFVSTVSHELRTPMTSIKGYADLMLMGAAGKLSDSQGRYLKVIKNNADRLHMLVNDLLDISRIETNRTILDLRPIDISQVINQVVQDHLQGRIQHTNREIEVHIETAASLPLVQADQARITQVLTNLLDNAYNYTPAQGHIWIRAVPAGNYVAVSVEDTGIGIDPKNLEKIFERFFRAEVDAVQNVSGTGLGLSIVNSLINMHGGTLEVESEVNEGSTFTFTLPIVLEDSDLP